MVKNILITGASDLIGGILVEHLSKNSNYDIYGIDKHIRLSQRYQLENTPISDNQQPILPSKEKFFICNITDQEKLSNVIQNNKINIIIHLAALLETATVEQINDINCRGTNILFDIATKHEHVEMVIYASTTMIFFGYLENEPYSALAKNIQPKEVLKKITNSVPKIPSHLNPSVEAYCQSKIYGEELAKKYSSNDNINVKFICVRLGWINATDDVSSNSTLYNWINKSNWCSHRDLCQFFDRLLENQLKLKKFNIYCLSSNNDFCWVDMDNAKEDLNYVPQDGEKWNET
jgi:nucleoside-diphosphate-sugar epimerase